MFGLFKPKHKKQPDKEWIRSTLAEIGKLEPEKTHVVYSEQISSDDYDRVVRHSTKLSATSVAKEKLAEWYATAKIETFQGMLLRLIKEKGMTNKAFYKAASIDRKLFSAIFNNQFYQPKKETAVACCFGLNLSLEQAEKLLEAAGFKLSMSIAWDRVVYYCLKTGITDLEVVNELLFESGCSCIRS